MITNIFSPSQSNELTAIATFSDYVTTTQYGMKSVTFGWNGSPKEIDVQDCKLIELGVGVQMCNAMAAGWPSDYPNEAMWWVPCGVYTMYPAYYGYPSIWNFLHPTISKPKNLSSWTVSWNSKNTYSGLQIPTVNENGITLYAQGDGWYLGTYQTYNVTLYK